MEMPLYWIVEKLRKYYQKILQANSNNIPPTNVKMISLIRVSPCTSKIAAHKKGSLTVEAAIILPLFFLGMVSLICLLEIFRIQAGVTISLNQSAKELGMYAYAAQEYMEESPVGSVTDAVCIAYASARLENEKNATVHLLQSTYEDHIIELQATGKYRVPVSVIPLRTLTFQNKVRVHDWTGYDSETDTGSHGNDYFVYVSPRQTVYHTSSACTHLNLSILQLNSEKIGAQRNQKGGKYYPCTHCIIGEKGEGTYYITKEGDRYHSLVTCQALKRTVKLVTKESVGDLKECSRCMGKGGIK